MFPKSVEVHRYSNMIRCALIFSHDYLLRSADMPRYSTTICWCTQYCPIIWCARMFSQYPPLSWIFSHDPPMCPNFLPWFFDVRWVLSVSTVYWWCPKIIRCAPLISNDCPVCPYTQHDPPMCIDFLPWGGLPLNFYNVILTHFFASGLIFWAKFSSCFQAANSIFLIVV